MMMDAARLRLLSDRGAYVICALYMCAVSLLAYLLDEPQKALRGIYLEEWLKIPAAALAIFMSWAAWRSIGAPSPARQFAANLRLSLRPSVVCGLMLYLTLGLFHGSFTAAKTLMEDLAPFAWDSPLARLDAAMHGGDAWRLVPHYRWLTRVLQWIYFPLWLIMLAGVSFGVSLFADDRLRRRYLSTFFFVWIVLGNVVALVFLSGGPIYTEALTGSDRFRPLMEYLQFSRGLAYSNVDVSDRLWAIHLIGNSEQGSGISAFPSLHLAMATLWALALPQMLPWLKWPMVLFVAVIEIGSVHLGWHYAIDGYFSIIVTLAVWKMTGLMHHSSAEAA